MLYEAKVVLEEQLVGLSTKDEKLGRFAIIYCFSIS